MRLWVLPRKPPRLAAMPMPPPSSPRLERDACLSGPNTAREGLDRAGDCWFTRASVAIHPGDYCDFFASVPPRKLCDFLASPAKLWLFTSPPIFRYRNNYG